MCARAHARACACSVLCTIKCRRKVRAGHMEMGRPSKVGQADIWGTRVLGQRELRAGSRKDCAWCLRTGEGVSVVGAERARGGVAGDEDLIRWPLTGFCKA